MVNSFPKFILFYFLIILNTSCFSQKQSTSIITGAQQVEQYLPLLKNKKIALVVNQTSVIFNSDSYTHIADSLKTLKVNIAKIFAPEHGFRGKADAGEYITNGIDKETGIEVVSLYGKNHKPSKEQLQGIDLLLFDIQDVGVRFYTYISTLHYIMEACAESNIPLLILDRPNPNGSYIDGPVLDTNFRSFVGIHPIPIVHGLTIAELAQMINGEKWLKNGKTCELSIIPCQNYKHEMEYILPIKPSPNLPNNQAIYLYPSLCLFEGVDQASVGRGTSFPFQVYGGLSPKIGNFTYTPLAIEGMDKNPKFKNQVCYGKDLRNYGNSKTFTLEFLINFYKNKNASIPFFNSFFEKLVGNNILRAQIEKGLSEKEIKKTWEKDLEIYKTKRAKYIIYK